MRYKMKVGINYPTSAKVVEELLGMAELPDEERQAKVSQIAQDGGFARAEAGDIVDNLPEVSIPWLLEQGHIKAVDDKKPAKTKPVVAAPAAPEGE